MNILHRKYVKNKDGKVHVFYLIYFVRYRIIDTQLISAGLTFVNHTLEYKHFTNIVYVYIVYILSVIIYCVSLKALLYQYIAQSPNASCNFSQVLHKRLD